MLSAIMLAAILLSAACGDSQENAEDENSDSLSVEEVVDVMMETPDRTSEAVDKLNDRITETEKVLGDIQ